MTLKALQDAAFVHLGRCEKFFWDQNAQVGGSLGIQPKPVEI